MSVAGISNIDIKLFIFLSFWIVISTPELNFSEKDKLKIPNPVGYTIDFEQVLTPDQKHRLENIIHEYEKKTTIEIAIVTVGTIEPYNDMKDFATDLSNLWGIGKRVRRINSKMEIKYCVQQDTYKKC